MEKSKKYTRTKDQQEYVDAILKVKRMAYKNKAVPAINKIISRVEYMNNCIFWINEFHGERCDKQRAVSAVTNLKIYCEEIIKELTA